MPSLKSGLVDGDNGALVPSKTKPTDEFQSDGHSKDQLDGHSKDVLESITSSLTMRQSASGIAATIAAIGQLPEATQLGQLKLEEERLKAEVGLEKHRLDLMARDRAEERSVQSSRYQIDKKQEQRTELLQYFYVAGVSSILLCLVIYLYVNGKSDVATPILTSALGLGAGWVGGKGSGYAKAQRERQPKSNES